MKFIFGNVEQDISPIISTSEKHSSKTPLQLSSFLTYAVQNGDKDSLNGFKRPIIVNLFSFMQSELKRIFMNPNHFNKNFVYFKIKWVKNHCLINHPSNKSIKDINMKIIYFFKNTKLNIFINLQLKKYLMK